MYFPKTRATLAQCSTIQLAAIFFLSSIAFAQSGQQVGVYGGFTITVNTEGGSVSSVELEKDGSTFTVTDNDKNDVETDEGKVEFRDPNEKDDSAMHNFIARRDKSGKVILYVFEARWNKKLDRYVTQEHHIQLESITSLSSSSDPLVGLGNLLHEMLR